MKKVIFFSLILIASFAFGQKIKSKNGIVSIDGKEFLKVKEDPISKLNFTIYSLNDDELFYLKFNSYKDTKEANYKSNPDGNVYYYELLNKDLDRSFFEIKAYYTFRGYDEMVKIIFNGKVINEDGTINQANLDILTKKLGFDYTRKRNELN